MFEGRSSNPPPQSAPQQQAPPANTDYFRPRESAPPRQEFSRPRSFDRGYDRGYDRAPDRGFDGPAGPRGDFGKKFGRMERESLRQHVQETQDFNEISRRLQRTPYECMRQWYFWDQQSDWDDADAQRAADLFNQNKTCTEIAELLNRSALGVWAKLQILGNNGRLQRKLGEPGIAEGAPFLIQLVHKCERIIDEAKDMSRGKDTIADIERIAKECLLLIEEKK
ncbi:Conserved_hypothetical protein [Hexamita inflata]|uniref:Uncharacterized protein n=1 Tax=Hexamita inflata TaxID=28002 RepID=A0AA86NWR1_9EUKA|nr:Conserved hypothetical protein [Hexamita inflata]